MPIRVREEVPGLFGDPARARRIEAVLRRLDGVEVVRASARTGRVLIRLRAPDAHVRARALEAMAPLADTRAEPPPSLRRIATNLARAWTRRRQRARERERLEEEARGEGPEEHWHAREADEVVTALGGDPARGLTRAEATSRRRRFGTNALAGIATRSDAEILVGQLTTVPVALLGGAIGVSVVLGDLVEAAAIAVVLGANVVVGYVVERRAVELLEAFHIVRSERARVLRDGHRVEIRTEDVVPGDVLVVRAGDHVAADGRIFEARDLASDESTLTGESLPVEKSALVAPLDAGLFERHSMIYAGTTIASGDGLAIVVATGDRTELGALRRALERARKAKAPLERQLDRLGTRLAVVSLASAVVVVGVSVLRGVPLPAIARAAVALGVAAIPEGLPAAGTTALALASRRLLARGIVIRRISAAETLGAVSVVCADKTGTLTMNRMRVAQLFVPSEGFFDVRWRGDESAEIADARGLAPSSGSLEALARIAALNSDSDVEVLEDGMIRHGSGTERALVELALAIGYPVARRRRSLRRVGEERRTVDHPFVVTFHDHPTLGRIELVKGAPEAVFERCALDARARAEATAANRTMASHGLRVLALAWRRAGAEINDATGEALTLVGLVGLRDPPREGVQAAVGALAEAGITTVMLTGDQAATARAVGEDLGIAPDAVFSRVTPAAKLDVVERLRGEGHVVAMTGDGVNDGPALKAADVGIAMGARGTAIARAVADAVLAEDDLASIVAAVEEGRRLYDNIRRAVDYLVATNLSEVLVSVVGAVLPAPPLQPMQLLWLNVLTDVAPALALTLEPEEAGLMTRPPRPREEQLLGPSELRRLGRDAAGMTLASLGAYALGALRGGAGRGGSMGFLTLAVSQILHVRACRASSDVPNRARTWSTAASLAAQAYAIADPGLRSALAVERLSAGDVLLSLVLAGAPTIARRHARHVGAHADEIVIVAPALEGRSTP